MQKKKKKVNFDNRKILDLALFIFSILLVTVFIISNERKISRTESKNIKLSKRSSEIAHKWLNAVYSKNNKLAIACAKTICDDSFKTPPIADFLDITRNSGISTSIITGEFSDLDAQRWLAAFEAAKIAKSLSSQNDSTDDFIKSLMSFLINKYQRNNNSKKQKNEASLWKILQNNSASTNEILRLASEIALQAGYIPLIVTFHDNQQNQLQIALELRKENKFYIISFESNHLFIGKSANELIGENTEFSAIKDAKFARYHLPAEISDYKTANTELNNILHNLLPDSELPVFGYNPKERIYEAVMNAKKRGIPHTLFAYWSYPFSCLKDDEEFSSFAIQNLKSLNK